MVAGGEPGRGDEVAAPQAAATHTRGPLARGPYPAPRRLPLHHGCRPRPLHGGASTASQGKSASLFFLAFLTQLASSAPPPRASSPRCIFIYGSKNQNLFKNRLPPLLHTPADLDAGFPRPSWPDPFLDGSAKHLSSPLSFRHAAAPPPLTRSRRCAAPRRRRAARPETPARDPRKEEQMPSTTRGHSHASCSRRCRAEPGPRGARARAGTPHHHASRSGRGTLAGTCAAHPRKRRAGPDLARPPPQHRSSSCSRGRPATHNGAAVRNGPVTGGTRLLPHRVGPRRHAQRHKRVLGVPSRAVARSPRRVFDRLLGHRWRPLQHNAETGNVSPSRRLHRFGRRLRFARRKRTAETKSERSRRAASRPEAPHFERPGAGHTPARAKTGNRRTTGTDAVRRTIPAESAEARKPHSRADFARLIFVEAAHNFHRSAPSNF